MNTEGRGTNNAGPGGGEAKISEFCDDRPFSILIKYYVILKRN